MLHGHVGVFAHEAHGPHYSPEKQFLARLQYNYQFFHIEQNYLALHIYEEFQGEYIPSFEQTLIPFTLKCLVSSFAKNSTVLLNLALCFLQKI